MRIIEGSYVENDYKIAIVVSRFNDTITSRLMDGAVDTLVRHNIKENNISVYKAPGSFEIPVVAKKVSLKKNNKVDAIICLGAIIRGDTPHFDFVCNEVSKGIAAVSLESEMPVIYGIVTTDTVDQAMDRAGIKLGNKGKDAALSALEMINLLKNI